MISDRLLDAADKCERIKIEFNALLGSRDFEDRARRIALRREFREASRQLKDACNDAIINLMAGPEEQPEQSDQPLILPHWLDDPE